MIREHPAGIIQFAYPESDRPRPHHCGNQDVEPAFSNLLLRHYYADLDIAEYARAVHKGEPTRHTRRRVRRQSAIVSHAWPRTDQPIRSGLDGHESRLSLVPNGRSARGSQEPATPPGLRVVTVTEARRQWAGRIFMHHRALGEHPHLPPVECYGRSPTVSADREKKGG